MAVPEVLISFGGATVRSPYYEVLRAVPALQRPIGQRVDTGRVVARYVDPVWTIEFRLGPLARADTLRLRQWVGRDNITVQFLDADRPLADFPSQEKWINADIEATLIDAVPQAVNADITRGDLWSLTIQAYESDMVAI